MSKTPEAQDAVVVPDEDPTALDGLDPAPQDETDDAAEPEPQVPVVEPAPPTKRDLIDAASDDAADRPINHVNDVASDGQMYCECGNPLPCPARGA